MKQGMTYCDHCEKISHTYCGKCTCCGMAKKYFNNNYTITIDEFMMTTADTKELQERIEQLEKENQLLYGRLNLIRDLTEKEIK